MKPEKENLRLDEVAEILRISRSTIYRMIDNGDLPAFKLPNRRSWLVKKETIEKILAETE
jgi:excisionase family DNA binding protein